ncbi:unnamed protein product [Acanthoscelides obtectus]|nr:unnamed protein product [Acanthoscelides obtectus]CAK1631199.1 Poly(ADP-ribose) glycohydrolase [Acanthoscelides obtectus]
MKGNLSPVATGNWGCGVYRGLSTLKSLLQLIACNAAERDMVYYTFGNRELRDDLYNMYLFISKNNITISELWRILCKFSSSNVPERNLYSFIQQAYFDSKKQPDSKKSVGEKIEQPSTSRESSSREIQPPQPSLTTNTSGSSKSGTDIRDFFGPGKEKQPSSNTAKSEDGPKNVEASRVTEETCDFEEDIIEGTPPTTVTDFKYKKKTKIKAKFTEEEIVQKLPKTDIALLMDDLEGVSKPSNEKSQPDSLLTQIDKMPRKTKVLKVEDQTLVASAFTIDEEMDVDFAEMSTSKEENKTPKRKISDYFNIKSKNN